ncbi:hypothetical protein E2C01_041867 [Portunus trituberculatus]|uniref:Uncharacterized protein n=1 Tax=Portunus trituberculatus TaxID=210409 RepID=A0A5B7FNM9_PORTR|nr:hypothetical protein [Portunus trituberculatus]
MWRLGVLCIGRCMCGGGSSVETGREGVWRSDVNIHPIKEEEEEEEEEEEQEEEEQEEEEEAASEPRTKY